MKSPCSAGPRACPTRRPRGEELSWEGSLTPEAGWVYVFYAGLGGAKRLGRHRGVRLLRRGMTAQGGAKAPPSLLLPGENPGFSCLFWARRV